MGMYDDIKCEYPLPDRQVQNKIFQTKSLQNNFDSYTITKEGRLIWHKYIYETVPEEKRPYYGKPEWDNPLMQLYGSTKSIPVGDIDMLHHGIVGFYTFITDGQKEKWFEYEAKFIDGQVVNIKCVKRHHIFGSGEAA